MSESTKAEYEVRLVYLLLFRRLRTIFNDS